MDKKHMKRCVISLVIGKAKIKTTRRYCFTPGRMAKVKKQTMTHVHKDMEKLERSCFAGGNVKW